MTDPITTHAFARAGLVGNPSDGYFGKTLSFIIRDFRAAVTLWETPHFEVVPGPADLGKFESVADFLADARLHGYYGGSRLLRAAVKRFHDHWAARGVDLIEQQPQNFSIRFDTDIPRLVGLSGSSAIVTATLRALMFFYDRQVPKGELPALTLSVERDELNIAAGLQDRVIQAYEGMVFMDFDREMVQRTGNGKYEELRPPMMPPLYVAYDPARAEISDVAHRNLRGLYDAGDPEVVGAMKKFAALTDRGRAAILSGDFDALHEVTNANYDLRKAIMPIAPENQRMVDVARSIGASAKFAGSGGAICGVCREEKYGKLVEALATIGCATLRPEVFPA